MKSFRKLLWLLLPVLAVAVIAGTFIKIKRQQAISEADQKVVDRVDEALAEAFAKDAELTQRLGSFQRLDGGGHTRPSYPWMLIDRVEFSRTAVYDRGSVTLNVMVGCDRNRGVAETPVGPITWHEDRHPARMPGGTTLEVWVPFYNGDPKPWQIQAAALSGDCRTVSLGGFNKIEAWDRSTRKKQREFAGGFGPVNHMSRSPGSNRLLVDCGQSLKVIDTSTGDFVSSWPFLGTRRRPMADFSGDGRTVVQSAYQSMGFGTNPRLALVHDLDSHASAPLELTGRKSQGPQKLLVSPNGSHALLHLTNMAGLQGWDLKARSLAWWKDDKAEVLRLGSKYGFLFTPVSSSLCVSMAYEHTVEVWTPHTGDLERTLDSPPEQVWKSWRSSGSMSIGDVLMTASSDEQLFAQAFQNGRVLVWNFPTGTFAGLISDTDWELEGTLASEESGATPGPSRTGIGSDRSITRERLGTIGFDESNRLIGVSHDGSTAWVWRAKMEKLNLDPR